ncbi:glyoxalase/bleomycin resistance protein/dioxygenase superfamily protein [Pseudomonas baetica]|uniref:Glyoxalase/bleomycin resistance protein/dioxygenase superfamily protein n=1 Tax=Pseudomonas baetica TaxID=674054 RepID=A0ABX4Q8A9_9PSED|nr:VOC family protein [Pseudomonas baetica]PKA72972.1 glyoxalase/bleomycin resistance protein/dioxygenase superfamily protein [Pseudomonas baetica]PTC19116.1 VOC family virulence protein [Pseudomonas baetica]
MHPFVIQHIDHIVLRVADLQRSIEFYGQVFGAEVVKINEPLGLVHLRAGTSMIDLVDLHGELGRKGGGAAGAERRNVDHFCLRIEPFDEAALIEHLQAHGLSVEKAARRFGAQGYGLSVYCFDPDGNQVELKGLSEV